jgi:hypothetical protein
MGETTEWTASPVGEGVASDRGGAAGAGAGVEDA